MTQALGVNSGLQIRAILSHRTVVEIAQSATKKKAGMAGVVTKAARTGAYDPDCRACAKSRRAYH